MVLMKPAPAFFARSIESAMQTEKRSRIVSRVFMLFLIPAVHLLSMNRTKGKKTATPGEGVAVKVLKQGVSPINKTVLLILRSLWSDYNRTPCI